MEDDIFDNVMLIIKDLPNGTQFGMDMQCYVVGDKFVGIKMIPPGPHFVYWSPLDSNGDGCIRYGFMEYFKKADIIVKEWKDEKNELVNRNITDEEKNKIRNSYDSIECFLVHYEMENYTKWLNLTNHITEKSIQILNPKSGIIRPHAELVSNAQFDRSTYNQNKVGMHKRRMKLDFLLEDDINFPFLEPVTDTAPNFTVLPDRCPNNSSSTDITKHYMDCVDAVDSLFKNFENTIDLLLSEIQFSYIIFLLNYSIEGLMQWRKLLLILSNSESAIKKYIHFYANYFNILLFQIPELPEELMSITHNNLVYRDVKQLVKNSNDSQQLKELLSKFTTKLRNDITWFSEDDLFDEDPEDLPTVVDL